MEREEYEKSIFDYEDVRDAIACAREDGVEEGFGKGMEKGMEAGKQQLILSMLAYGLDAEVISASTGLSKDEILRMKE